MGREEEKPAHTSTDWKGEAPAGLKEEFWLDKCNFLIGTNESDQ